MFALVKGSVLRLAGGGRERRGRESFASCACGGGFEKKKRIIDKQFTQFPAVSLAPSPASTPLLRQEVVRDLPSAEVSHGEPQHGPQLAHRLRQYLGLRDRDQRSKANANRGKDEPAGDPGEVGGSLPLEVFQGVREPLALVLLDGVRVRAVLIPRELWGGS